MFIGLNGSCIHRSHRKKERHILLIPMGKFGVLTDNTHAMIITMYVEVSEFGGCACNHEQLEVQCLAQDVNWHLTFLLVRAGLEPATKVRLCKMLSLNTYKFVSSVSLVCFQPVLTKSDALGTPLASHFLMLPSTVVV